MTNAVPRRSRLGVFATGAFAVSAVTWLVVQVVGTPTVGWWKALVVPGFVIGIPLFGTVVWRTRRRPGRLTHFFPRGSRRPLAIVLLAVVAAIGFSRSFGGPLNVVQQDGGYFFSNHGDLTPATLRDFQESEASQAGLFASFALLFNGIGALTLTQIRPSGGATAPRFRPTTGRRPPRG